MTKKTWYIAGPWRGKPEWNKPAFDAAASRIQARGDQPINPHDWNDIDPDPKDLWHVPSDFNMRKYAKVDLEAIIDHCNGVYLLDGWDRSAGARAEAFTAYWIGLDFDYESPKTLRIGDAICYLTGDTSYYDEGVTPDSPLPALAREMAEEELDIMLAKNADYTAKSGDPYANFRMSQLLGIDPILGLLIRCMDKFQRIRSYINNGRLEVADESVYDAISDVRNYMVLCRGLIDERKGKFPQCDRED